MVFFIFFGNFETKLILTKICKCTNDNSAVICCATVIIGDTDAFLITN